MDPTKRPSNKNLAIVMAASGATMADCDKDFASEQRRALVADIVANEQVMEWITNGGNDIIEEMYFHEGEDCFQDEYSKSKKFGTYDANPSREDWVEAFLQRIETSPGLVDEVLETGEDLPAGLPDAVSVFLTTNPLVIQATATAIALRDSATANTKQYKIIHLAIADISEDGWERMETFHSSAGVDMSNDLTVFTVDIAISTLTQEHAAAIQDGDIDLNEFCTSIFANDEPEWMESSEEMGEFEGGDIRIDMETSVRDYCELCHLDTEAFEELLGEIIQGSLETHDVSLEECVGL